MAAFIVVLSFAGSACANEDKATAKEVYQLVLNAHEVLTELDEEGLAAFNDPKGEFVYKDTAVYVLQCPEYIVAHPFILDQVKGKDMRKITPFHNSLCDAAKNPKGQWVEFFTPKPGETTPSRNVSFILQCEGTPYQIAAGIFSDTLSVEKLNQTLR